ncbi:MAG: T9SS type A sorting domain-containing protein [Bacteroidota bacterium]|nr:T9SS type A sorting domain-containing protein [Bacteroidota bacterium]MDP3145919.1 T9SS type A sorting domain-containing protein [Bacteroidota bacterium]MDP3558555.1 T9SS type A sorting domain-containing protein [Bacteroidota bacterium]
MIKKLLTIATVLLTVSANSQNGKISSNTISEVMPITISTDKASSAPGCSTVSVINPTANISLYTVSTSSACTTGGYVFGNNCYGFTEIATYFDAASFAAVTGPSITAVAVGFYRNAITLRGTKGTTGTVGMNVYSGTSNTVMPGSTITSTTATLAQVVAAQTSTSSLFFYTFTLTPTAIASSGFYASLVLPTVTGDTAVIYTQTTSVTPSATNNAWGKMAATWSSANANWNLNVNHVMLPIVCGSNITTGISNNLGLSKDVRIMPNPSTGLVNVLLTLAQTENISVSVTNALGQQVLSTKYDGISNELISLDLTNQSNGVYFVTVSNGKDKMVQRLILNK